MTNPGLSSQFPGESHQKDDYRYFLPGDLFLSRQLNFEFSVLKRLEQAVLKLGQFSSKIKDLPDIDLFIGAYSKREATQSTRIEGTKTSIEEAFQEDEGAIAVEKINDWHELQQYIKAMNYAVGQLDAVPLSVRLIKNTHAILLSQARGEHRLPGEFRESQNWLGGSSPSTARFVPPSSEHVVEAMSNLEKFIHDEQSMPHLIKIALIHYQFETIHPFLDGNGRMGRMLIPLYLMVQGVIEKPILYISDFFEKNRRDYYDALDRGRQDEQSLIKWVSFFLDGVIATADTGLKETYTILDLRDKVEHRILQLGRRVKNAQKLTKLLFHQPIVTSSIVRTHLKISAATAQKLLADFVRLGILSEMTGQKRNRSFSFEDYFKILRGQDVPFSDQ